MRPMTTHTQTSHRFVENAREALADRHLKIGLDRTTGLLRSRRKAAVEAFPQYADVREAGSRIKAHVLDNLDVYLERFVHNAEAAGAVVHLAETKERACEIVVEICRQHKVRSATRVKSMLGEEIGLPAALERAGIERVETDLAEHIIQLAGDPPSHIVVPALHKTHEQVGELFRAHHREPMASDEIPDMVESARRELRRRYFKADAGISGANFLIADSGTVVTVTNEGNAELTTELPDLHIVTAGIEKLVPNLAHTNILLRLLARAALGMEITQYTSFFTGPKRKGDRDGPLAMHIVLVDNRRSEMLADPLLKPMLKCIRCGACMNHCPVYAAVGGHSYGAVYPGPMGAILTPSLSSLEEAKDLPHACTLNGACQEVCPVKIPLTDIMRDLRARTFERGLVKGPARMALAIWGMLVRSPRLYRWATELGLLSLRVWGAGRRKLRSAPLAADWTTARDLPAAPKESFLRAYKRGRS